MKIIHSIRLKLKLAKIPGIWR